MTQSEELVTVYIPTHRRPEMATRAVKSVLAQDYPNIELIVCDDGTPAEQTESLKTLLEEHGATYLRNESPMGACYARNVAISRATGTLITGLDDDDEFSVDRVGELVSGYSPSLAFIAASYNVVSSSGVSKRTFDAGSITYDQLLHYNKVGNQVLTETSRVKEVGAFDIEFPAMQDYELWLRLCKNYGTAKKLNSCSYTLHTEHEEARISSQPTKLQNALRKLRAKYKSDLKPKHDRTHAILAKRIEGNPPSLIRAIGAIHKDNYRMILSPYIRS